MTAKACTRCGRVLPLSEFYRDSRVPVGRTSHCKTCCKTAQRARQTRAAPQPKPAKALADLFTTPELPGALCRGRWALFDPADRDDDHQVVERLHTEAVALCSRCPALAACQSWLESLPAHKRPTGIVAGRLVEEMKR